MAMAMQELFYGESEPVYLVHYGRHSSSSGSYSYGGHHAAERPDCRSRRMELSTFDLMVPMCCTRCEDHVRDALLALGSVRDVVCDPRYQRVTVTGCLDPAQALKQVRRVKNGATFWSAGSSYSTHRYEVSSHQQSHRHIHQDNRDRRPYVQLDARERRSHSGQYNRSSSDAYTRSLCPAYRDSTRTHYLDVNPTIATRVEMEC